MCELKLVCVQDVEKELEVQIGMKQEMELSMKMLEKDICEKQDALVELRQQLDDLRAINQQLSHKSQVRLICAPSASLHFTPLHPIPLHYYHFFNLCAALRQTVQW